MCEMLCEHDGFWRLMKSVQGRFYYGVRGNGVRHAKQGDDAAAFTRRQEQPLAIGARDERRRRHSRAPTLRRYAATSPWPYLMAYPRAVLPSLQRSE
jgi:hypothetical protein